MRLPKGEQVFCASLSWIPKHFLRSPKKHWSYAIMMLKLVKIKAGLLVLQKIVKLPVMIV